MRYCNWCKEDTHYFSNCKKRYELKCYNCTKFGHTTEKCKGRPFCYVCLEIGHRFIDCSKAIQKRRDALDGVLDGFYTCAQGMADLYDDYEKEYEFKCFKESEKIQREFEKNKIKPK